MSYTGTIFTVPVGQAGLVGTRNQSNITPDKLIVARNLSFEGGVLRKEGGATKFNAGAIGGSILGGWDWWPTSGVQRSVVFCGDGAIRKDTGGGTYTVGLAAGLTAAGVTPVFVEGGKESAALNRKLFIFTGVNAVQVLSGDGVATTAIATPPADWAGANQPSFGLIHEGRLWGAGNGNDPHRIYFSTTASHEDMTGAGSGSFSVYPGEGERLVGGVSFKGLLILWKFPLGIYIIDTTDPSLTNWKVRRLSRSVGGVSPLAFCEVDNDIVFMDHTANFHLLSAVTEFGDAAASNISRKAEVYSFIQNNFNFAQLPSTKAVYYAAKREAHFAMAGTGQNTNTVRFVLDFNREDMIRFRYSDRDLPQSIWLKKDSSNVQRLTIGDPNGFVWNLDSATKSQAGVGYPGSFQTPYMDFNWEDPKLATVRKIGQFIEVVMEPVGNWNMTIGVFWDGNFVHNVTVNVGSTGAALGSFVLGTDALSGDQILNRKRRIMGSGRRISLSGTNGGAGEDFSIARIYLHCQIGDERPGRGE